MATKEPRSSGCRVVLSLQARLVLTLHHPKQDFGVQKPRLIKWSGNGARRAVCFARCWRSRSCEFGHTQPEHTQMHSIATGLAMPFFLRTTSIHKTTNSLLSLSQGRRVKCAREKCCTFVNKWARRRLNSTIACVLLSSRLMLLPPPPHHATQVLHAYISSNPEVASRRWVLSRRGCVAPSLSPRKSRQDARTRKGELANPYWSTTLRSLPGHTDP